MTHTLTSHQRVYRSVHFQTPDRLPIFMPAFGFEDFTWVTPHIPSEFITTGLGADEWGCVWEKTAVKNMGQIRVHPLADWSALDHYRFPDPACAEAFAGFGEKLDRQAGKYILFERFMLLFERMHSLRGFAATLEDLYAEPDRSAELADRIVEFNLRFLRHTATVAGNRIHAFYFTDDWGTQLAPFISRGLWQKFFKPRYARIFAEAHALGWDVWMHSCGKITDIIEDLIEIGVNVLNLQQPRALGIEEIGRRYAGRVAFSSLCDIQATLPTGSRDRIREDARLLLAHWATPRGGFVVQDYHDAAAIGTSDEAKRIMFDAFREFDPWRKTGGAP